MNTLMTFEQAVHGTNAPKEIIHELQLITVPFANFNGEHQLGQLVVNRALAEELAAIFKSIAALSFPIEKIIPICQYAWDDERSTSDNNSSAFNYRLISGTNTPSWHGFGRAVDINPRLNPYFGRLGIEPKGAQYKPSIAGTLVESSPVVKIFDDYGWEWLGRREEHTDFQHFQKKD